LDGNLEIKLSSKVKHFLWKLLRSYLPTRKRILHKASLVQQTVPFAPTVQRVIDTSSLITTWLEASGLKLVFGPSLMLKHNMQKISKI